MVFIAIGERLRDGKLCDAELPSIWTSFRHEGVLHLLRGLPRRIISHGVQTMLHFIPIIDNDPAEQRSAAHGGTTVQHKSKQKLQLLSGRTAFEHGD